MSERHRPHDPHVIPALPESLRRVIENTVREILEQQYECSSALLRVKRSANTVTIEWEFKKSVPDPQRRYVKGALREMSLIPDKHHNMDRIVYEGRGEGTCKLQLDEGCSYYFQFIFMDAAMAESRDPKAVFADDQLDDIAFQVAVPLADERKGLLRQVLHFHLRPEERLRTKLEDFLSTQETFDNMCKEAVERIKARALSPDVAQQRIMEFMEHAERVKDDLGM